MKNLLERFSCHLVGRGKKVSGHKILLKSLFILREKNTEKKGMLNLALQKNLFEKTKERLLGKTKTNWCTNKTKEENTTYQKTHLANDFAKKYVIRNENLRKRQNSKDNQESIKQNDAILSIAKNCHENKEKVKKIKQSAFEKDTSLSRDKKQLIPNSLNLSPFGDKSTFSLEMLLNKSVCQLCVDNVKPILETRKVRKGRITYRVPKITGFRRQEGKAINLLIENATSRRKSDSKRSTLPSLKTFEGNQRSSPLPGTPSLKIAPSEKLSTSVKKTETKRQHWFSEQHSFSQKKSTTIYSIKHCLSEEFLDSANGKGESVEKKKQLHQFALQNRANLHFRWW